MSDIRGLSCRGLQQTESLISKERCNLDAFELSCYYFHMALEFKLYPCFAPLHSYMFLIIWGISRTDFEPNSLHVYSKLAPILVNETYSQGMQLGLQSELISSQLQLCSQLNNYVHLILFVTQNTFQLVLIDFSQFVMQNMMLRYFIVACLGFNLSHSSFPINFNFCQDQPLLYTYIVIKITRVHRIAQLQGCIAQSFTASIK